MAKSTAKYWPKRQNNKTILPFFFALDGKIDTALE